MIIAERIKVTQMPDATQDTGLIMVSQGDENALESKHMQAFFGNGPEYIQFKAGNISDQQASFSRASEGYYWDSETSTYKVASTNEPRFTDEGILIEDQATNFAFGDIVGTSTVSVTDNQTSVLENHNSILLTKTDPFIYSNVIVGEVNNLQSDKITCNLILEKNGTNNVQILLKQYAPVSSNIFFYSIDFDAADGPITATNITGYQKTLTPTGPNGGKLISVSFTYNSNITTDMDIKIIFYPHFVANEINKSVYLHHVQMEPGSYSSSPIVKTDNNPKTRAADTLFIDVYSKFKTTGGTVDAKFNNIHPVNKDSVEPKLLFGIKKNGESGDVVSIGYTGYDTNDFKCRVKGFETSLDQSVTLGDTHTDVSSGNLSFTFDGTETLFSLNGKPTVIVTGSLGNYSENINELYIDSGINGHIEHITILPKKITSEQLERISNNEE